MAVGDSQVVEDRQYEDMDIILWSTRSSGSVQSVCDSENDLQLVNDINEDSFQNHGQCHSRYKQTLSHNYYG
jgi:hypothetical protein